MPPYLVVSLDRLNLITEDKLEAFISFPIKDLNLRSIMREQAFKEMDDKGQPPIYDLCGVINHYGDLGGGHYTAACLNSDD